jgi:hypothetical protein
LEKELIGFYFSGHPMDEFRGLWERSSDAPVAHPERASPDRTYTLVAMLKSFREIITKSGKKMAFGEVEDWNGSLEIVVFSDVLERHRERFLVDKVLFLRGKIDVSRNAPSFKVDELVDPGELAAKSWREVHLRLRAGIGAEDELFDLRDLVFESPGSCQVWLHVPLGGEAGAPAAPAPVGDCEVDEDGIPLPPSIEACAEEEEVPAARVASTPGPAPDEVLIRANAQITCSANEEVLDRFRALAVVAEAWLD